MNPDIETAGAAVTAGLAAYELDRTGAPGQVRGGDGGDGGDGGAEGHEAVCANCGATLAGNFCHVCGQRSHIHRSLLHLGEEVLHGILHFDAKGWRTLPLLVAKPGELTRRYIAGQRTRFVSPLALFLFMIFFLFFVGSYFSKGNVNVGNMSDMKKARAELQADMDTARATLQKAEADLAGAGATEPGKKVELEADIKEARTGLAAMEKAARVYDLAAESPGLNVRASGPGVSDDFKVNTGIGAIDTAAKHAMENPELALYKIKNTAYKFSFLLVPISLPFLWLMFFWRRGLTMYDHAVFSLYSLSFMSLLFVVLFLLKYAGLGGAVAALLFGVPPVHMFLQLRGAYGLTFMQTLWRTAVLLTVSGTVFLLYLIVILLLSM
ncbi:MAG: DUF3667 domain-containing protein [Telluria sp.]